MVIWNEIYTDDRKELDEKFIFHAQLLVKIN